MLLKGRTLALILFVALGVPVFYGCGSPVEDSGLDETASVYLYFPYREKQELGEEAREISLQGRSLEEAVIHELMKGPATGDKIQAIPEDTRLFSLRIQDGIAYVEFSEEFVDNHPGGSFHVRATDEAIVKSLQQLQGISGVVVTPSLESLLPLADRKGQSIQLDLNVTGQPTNLIIGEDLLAVVGHKGTAFHRREDLSLVQAVDFGGSGFFFGNRFFVATKDARIYRVEEEGEGPRVIWEGDTLSEGSPAIKGTAVDDTYLVLYRGGFFKIFLSEEGLLAPLVFSPDWVVTDVMPYGDKTVLVATVDRGWLLLDLEDLSVKEMGAGGPFEAKKWESVGRFVDAGRPLVSEFKLATPRGILYAVTRQLMEACMGFYHQVWAPSPGGMRLVAENWHYPGDSAWGIEGDGHLGELWSFDWEGKYAVNYSQYGGLPRDMNMLVLNQEAALQAAARNDEPGILSDFLEIIHTTDVDGFAGCINLEIGDFTGNGVPEVIASTGDGLVLVEFRGENEVSITLISDAGFPPFATPYGRRVGVSGQDGEIYFVAEGALYKVRLE